MAFTIVKICLCSSSENKVPNLIQGNKRLIYNTADFTGQMAYIGSEGKKVNPISGVKGQVTS